MKPAEALAALATHVEPAGLDILPLEDVRMARVRCRSCGWVDTWVVQAALTQPLAKPKQVHGFGLGCVPCSVRAAEVRAPRLDLPAPPQPKQEALGI